MRHVIAGTLLLSLVAASPARASEAAEPFAASRDPATFDRSLECLTQAIYYEARSQSDDGQRAVAQVVLNRVRHPAYPSSVCGVVYQGSQRSTGCQFTFTCDGSMAGGIQPYAWERARQIATAALRGSVYRPVGLALNYHTTAIRPYWAPSLVQQAVVGAHVFYRRPGSGTIEAFTQMPSGEEPEPAPQTFYESPRMETRQRGRRGGLRYEPAVVEIPVVERPVVFRTIGARSTSRAQSAQPQPRAAAAPRRAPRVTVQNGVRVYRGS